MFSSWVDVRPHEVTVRVLAPSQLAPMWRVRTDLKIGGVFDPFPPDQFQGGLEAEAADSILEGGADIAAGEHKSCSDFGAVAAGEIVASNGSQSAHGHGGT